MGVPLGSLTCSANSGGAMETAQDGDKNGRAW